VASTPKKVAGSHESCDASADDRDARPHVRDYASAARSVGLGSTGSQEPRP
jgi:hypothetical protein